MICSRKGLLFEIGRPFERKRTGPPPLDASEGNLLDV